jgi:TMEM175 potassium channel family protein
VNSHKELQRIEAFSDGVFAIACTILILEFTVPHLEDMTRPGALWPALKALWPSFVAYLLSFGSILIAWAGHHRALNMLVGSSKAFLFANGLLLLTITFMPFPTAVLAEYISTPQANIAVTFYSAAWLVSNLGFDVWWLSMFRPVRLFAASVSKAVLKKATIQMFVGLVIYAGTTVLSYWFPITGFIIIFSAQALWIIVAVNEDEKLT